MIDIRRTVETDADVLRSIRLRALASDPTAFGATHADVVQYGDDVWRERATGSADNATFLAFDGDVAVGMAVGVETSSARDRVELVSMWTAPEARGSGVGRRLVETVLDWATVRGTPEVRLWVTRGNDAAQRLYERCGFVLTDEVGVSASDPCREEVRMLRSPRD